MTPVPPPAGKSSRRAWIGICIILVVLVAVIGRILLSGPEPEDSFNQARMAYMDHDQVKFDKYVDVQSVLSDWTDQAANGWLQDQHAGVGETLLVQAAVQAVKIAYLPSMSQSVDHLVISGNLMQQPDSDGGNQTDAFIAGLLSSWVHTLVSSQLTYEGVASKSVSGTDAFLDVKVATPLSHQPIVVMIKMQKDGDHWRVVAVQDLAGLLQQLGHSAGQ